MNLKCARHGYILARNWSSMIKRLRLQQGEHIEISWSNGELFVSREGDGIGNRGGGAGATGTGAEGSGPREDGARSSRLREDEAGGNLLIGDGASGSELREDDAGGTGPDEIRAVNQSIGVTNVAQEGDTLGRGATLLRDLAWDLYHEGYVQVGNRSESADGDETGENSNQISGGALTGGNGNGNEIGEE